MSETRAQRLRLLLLAGVLAPVLMAGAGLLLPRIFGHAAPVLARAPGPIAVVVALLTGAASMGLVWLLSHLHPALERALRHTGTRVGLEALEVAGYPVMLVVVTASAFGEEMLFRGGLQPVIGIIPAAVLFGFSHGGWRREMWAYVTVASLSGALFGALYALTGVIWAPILAHAVHNIASTVMMGKKFEASWDGLWPRIRLVPDPRDLEVLDDAARDVDEPVPAEADSPADGTDAGDSPAGEPE